MRSNKCEHTEASPSSESRGLDSLARTPAAAMTATASTLEVSTAPSVKITGLGVTEQMRTFDEEGYRRRAGCVCLGEGRTRVRARRGVPCGGQGRPGPRAGGQRPHTV